MLTSEWKIDKALEVSKKEKARETAKNLLDILDVETISKKTGLSIEEVENLKEE